jgi:hypothetical protein
MPVTYRAIFSIFPIMLTDFINNLWLGEATAELRQPRAKGEG